MRGSSSLDFHRKRDESWLGLVLEDLDRLSDLRRDLLGRRPLPAVRPRAPDSGVSAPADEVRLCETDIDRADFGGPPVGERADFGGERDLAVPLLDLVQDSRDVLESLGEGDL